MLFLFYYYRVARLFQTWENERGAYASASEEGPSTVIYPCAQLLNPNELLWSPAAFFGRAGVIHCYITREASRRITTSFHPL